MIFSARHQYKFEPEFSIERSNVWVLLVFGECIIALAHFPESRNFTYYIAFIYGSVSVFQVIYQFVVCFLSVTNLLRHSTLILFTQSTCFS